MVKGESSTADKVSLSTQIWEKIKDLDLEVFAISNKTVEEYVKPVIDMSPTELHVILSAGAVLPALEERLTKVRWSPTEVLSVGTKSAFAVISVQPK